MKNVVLPDNYKDYIHDDSNLKKIFRDLISDYAGNIKVELSASDSEYVAPIERIIVHLHDEYDKKLQSIRISVVVKEELKQEQEEVSSEEIEEIKIEEKRTNRRK
jgi:6-pyruvoyl-tetrahydropterin synthase